MKPVWRWGLLAAAVGLVVVLARPGCLFGRSAIEDHLDRRPELPPSFVDDASRLERAQVREVFAVPATMAEAEPALRDLLRRATKEGLKVSIAGARHTQGGHTIAADGIAIDMTPLRRIELDEGAKILHVEAGARWTDVIDALDPRFAVAVMQSNDTFTVGGTLGANAHGWQTRRPPVASTVQSFRLMTVDGRIHRCSREDNEELFSATLGGYGLIGVVLDVELKVVDNALYQATRKVVATPDYAEAFEDEVVNTPGAAMAYGRMDVTPGPPFLAEAILTVFRPVDDPSKLPSATEGTFAKARRTLFRASVDSDYGKRVRWTAEKGFGRVLQRKTFTRNDLMSQGVEVYENRTADTTDILHEYFVPRAQFAAFVQRLQSIVVQHEGNLLNVTVRDVLPDEDAMLRYADQDMFAFVMLFNQPLDESADEQMRAMTEALVEAALALGGRHYLPYRRHATLEQVRRGYPKLDAFAKLKRRHDPAATLSNRFYETYVAPSAAED